MKRIIPRSLLQTLFLLSCVSLFSSPAYTQTDEFNYSTTVALILQVEGGGHIFQRPDYDEPRNYFIIIYGIVGKYALQMQSQHDGLALDISSMPVEEKFLLINHETQKLLFMGDHWIGDGERFAIMDTGDYHRLQERFAETRKIREEPTPKPFLDSYTKRIHQLWSDDPDDFYREYYFPNQQSGSDTNATSKAVANAPTKPAGEIEASEQAQEEQKLPVKAETESLDETEKKSRDKTAIESPANNEVLTPAVRQKISESQSRTENNNSEASKPWGWILLLAALSLAGYWRLKQTK